MTKRVIAKQTFPLGFESAKAQCARCRAALVASDSLHECVPRFSTANAPLPPEDEDETGLLATA